VTVIDDYTFYNCTGLTSVTIPDGVTTIGYSAFSGCRDLVDVTIPSSVTTIGGWGFRDCGNLKTVYYLGSKADWEKITMSGGNISLQWADIHYNSEP